MFKAKVYYYSNQNWKENKFEKEFDNETDYQQFVKTNDYWIWNFDWGNMLNFNKYLDHFFDRKLFGIGYDEPNETKEDIDNWWFVDLSTYEKELQNLHQSKREKELRKSQLEKTLEKLRDYKKQFKLEWKEDLVKNVQADIDKVESELKQQ